MRLFAAIPGLLLQRYLGIGRGLLLPDISFVVRCDAFYHRRRHSRMLMLRNSGLGDSFGREFLNDILNLLVRTLLLMLLPSPVVNTRIPLPVLLIIFWRRECTCNFATWLVLSFRLRIVVLQLRAVLALLLGGQTPLQLPLLPAARVLNLHLRSSFTLSLRLERSFRLIIQLVQLKLGLNQRICGLDQRVFDAFLVLLIRVIELLLELLNIVRLTLHQLFNLLIRFVNFLLQEKLKMLLLVVLERRNLSIFVQNRLSFVYLFLYLRCLVAVLNL